MKKLSFEILQTQKNIVLPKKKLNQVSGGTVVNFLEIQNGGTFTGIASSSSTNG